MLPNMAYQALVNHPPPPSPKFNILGIYHVYMGKPEIPQIGKSNGLHHFVWEGSDLRECNFLILFSLFSRFGYNM